MVFVIDVVCCVMGEVWWFGGVVVCLWVWMIVCGVVVMCVFYMYWCVRVGGFVMVVMCFGVVMCGFLVSYEVFMVLVWWEMLGC